MSLSKAPSPTRIQTFESDTCRSSVIVDTKTEVVKIKKEKYVSPYS